MGHKKLIRFQEINNFPNVLQHPHEMPGKWNIFFKNDNPIVLELACGKGEYSIGLGELYPDRNFVGVDLKGNRIWVGAKKALEKNLPNVSFLRIQIDHIPEYFKKEEVTEIWITFPDPQLRKSKAKKRLTHPKFLRLYHHFLKQQGRIHLKTDSPVLYEFTKMVIGMYDCHLIYDTNDLYNEGGGLPSELRIQTYYESLDIAQSKRIHYLCFSLPEKLPGKENDEYLKLRLKEHERGTG